METLILQVMQIGLNVTVEVIMLVLNHHSAFTVGQNSMMIIKNQWRLSQIMFLDVVDVVQE